nr:NADH dehydrogenase subunit 4 [Nigrobaetis niger]
MLKLMMITVLTLPLCFYNKWAETTLVLLLTSATSMIILVNKMTPLNCMYTFSYDILSMTLVSLSIWLSALMITASSSIKRYKFKSTWFISAIVVLCLLLILTFCASNLFMFYLLFEATLIPTLLLIVGWGYQPERIQAGVYMLFYTLMASLPLLLVIFWVKNKEGTLDLNLAVLNYNNSVSMWGSLALMGAFLVKMPMFFVHLWLPKAHVEAPVSGSMILAGVLLKLGGYGLIRLNPLFSHKMYSINSICTTISLIGGCLVSFICLRQTDTKSLVAYSSVAHMGLVIAGIMVNSFLGMVGSLTLMIAHGLCSSGMFCLTNIIFERTGSRNLLLCKGLMYIMPSMAIWWFMICICNMAAPPTINLMGEIFLINSICSWSLTCFLPLMIMSFMSAAFTLYLFSYTQHGKPNSSFYSFSSGVMSEFTTLILHWLPVNMIILKAEMFMM